MSLRKSIIWCTICSTILNWASCNFKDYLIHIFISHFVLCLLFMWINSTILIVFSCVIHYRFSTNLTVPSVLFIRQISRAKWSSSHLNTLLSAKKKKRMFPLFSTETKSCHCPKSTLIYYYTKSNDLDTLSRAFWMLGNIT